jgi:hypothetical protein
VRWRVLARNGFLDNLAGPGRKGKRIQLARRNPPRIERIAPGPQFPAQVRRREIDHDEMVLDPAPDIPLDQLEHIDQIAEGYLYSALFANFALRGLAQRLTQFNSAAGQAPIAAPRRITALDQ